MVNNAAGDTYRVDLATGDLQFEFATSISMWDGG
jgi:hypothetical protein